MAETVVADGPDRADDDDGDDCQCQEKFHTAMMRPQEAKKEWQKRLF